MSPSQHAPTRDMKYPLTQKRWYKVVPYVRHHPLTTPCKLKGFVILAGHWIVFCVTLPINGVQANLRGRVMQPWPDLVHHCLLQTQHGRADGGWLNDDQGFRLVTLPSTLGTIETALAKYGCCKCSKNYLCSLTATISKGACC
jgi:hypothetical protein